MAVTDHIETYRSYSPAELDAEIEELKKARSGGYTSQAVRSKNYTKDLRFLSDQLRAAIRVKNERTQGPGNRDRGVLDFSGAS